MFDSVPLTELYVLMKYLKYIQMNTKSSMGLIVSGTSNRNAIKSYIIR